MKFKSLLKVIIPALIALSAALIIWKLDATTTTKKEAKEVSRNVLIACNNRVAKTRRLIGFVTRRSENPNVKITRDDIREFETIKKEYRKMIDSWNTEHNYLLSNINIHFPDKSGSKFLSITKKFENLNNNYIEKMILLKELKNIIKNNSNNELRFLIKPLNDIDVSIKELNELMTKTISN